MNESKIIGELLGLPQLRVTDYQMVGISRIEISIETTLEVAVCPTCGELSQDAYRKDEAQQIRDLRMWNRTCILRYTPRRYRWRKCQDSFTEQVVWRSAGRSYTQRYEQWIAERARQEPISRIAEGEGISAETVQGMFERMAKKT
jgi:transposase